MRILQWMWLMVLATMIATAQVVERRGTSVVSEGTSYVVAFPMVQAHVTEKPLPKPMMLLISSRTAATVTIQSSGRNADVPQINRTIELKAGEVYKFDVSTVYMNGITPGGTLESQVVREKGIRLIADRPISVMTYQAWMGNGELARHIPVASWGTEYVTMNMYQDRYQGAQANSKEYQPSQIIIIAAHDSTDVTYTPRVTTEGSALHPSVAAGTTKTIRLNAGQTFVIKDRIDTTVFRDLKSDMSGTFITATKPIGVLSGHTKVAVMRMPDVIPPTGMLAQPANMVRNNVHDVMLPTSLAGTEFITTPLQHSPTRVLGQGSAEFGIDDDRGDVIRILALHDGTKVTALHADGSGFQVVATLDKGESYLATSVEEPMFLQTDKPALAGQYGKSYAKILPSVLRKNVGTDSPQLLPTPEVGTPMLQMVPPLLPTTEAGMPMLQMVPPLSRAIAYGAFWAPEGMDNFFNLVCKTAEAGLINVDGRPLTDRFGSSIAQIRGTEYSYVRTPIGSGNHVVSSDNPNVRWIAWSYGSLDGLQQGRAYGAPLGVDAVTPCSDSIVVTDQLDCDVQATIALTGSGQQCSAIHSIYADTLVNAVLNVDTTFQPGLSTATSYTVNFTDSFAFGSAVIRVQSSSGSWVTRTYTYDPMLRAPQVEVIGIPDTFAIAHVDSLFCVDAFIKNPGTATIDVRGIRLQYRNSRGNVAPTDVRIPPFDSVVVRICLSSFSSQRKVVDTLLADIGCGTQTLGILRAQFVYPSIECSDQEWSDVEATSPGVEKPIEIRNAGDVPLTIRAIEGDTLDFATTNFGNVRGLDALPIVIPAKSTYTWYVTYAPKGEVNVQHRATVIISSDALGIDNRTVLTGRAATTSVESDTTQAFSIAPNPTTGLLHLGSVDGVTSMQLVSQHGSVSDLPVHTTIDLGHMPTGVYTLRMVGRKSVRVARVMLTR